MGAERWPVSDWEGFSTQEGAMSTFRWPPEAYQDLPLHVRALRALLQEWFVAIEDGSAGQRLPDPLYAPFPDDYPDRLIQHLEAQFDRERRSWGYQESAGGYGATPGFDRLAPLQRLAFAQDFHRIMVLYQVWER